MRKERSTTAGLADSWRRHRLALSALVAAVVLLFSPVLVGEETLFYRDLYRQHLGTARLLEDGTLRSGLLWDSLLNGGQPLLGNPNRFVLYPTRLLYLVLDAVPALNWEIVLHLLLGAVGAYVLAARLGRSPPACVVAGVVFALAGPSVSLTNHLGRHLAFQWLPWVVVAFDGLAGSGGRRRPAWIGAAAVSVALQWLTGAAEVVLATALTVVVWVAFVSEPRQRRLRRLGATAATLVLATGAAAVQVVPAAETVLLSSRADPHPAAQALVWSVHPLRLVELVVAGALGPVDVAVPQLQYWGAGIVDLGFPYLLSLYLGVSVLLLASLAFVGSTSDTAWDRLRWVLLVLAGVGVVTALGRHAGPPVRALFGLPGMDLMRYPVKAILLTVLPAALLASLGIDRLATLTRRQGRWLAGAAAAVATAAGACVVLALVAPADAARAVEMLFDTPTGSVPPMLARALATTAALAAAVAGAAVLARRGHARTVRLAAVVLVVTDLGVAAAAVMPLAPRWIFSSPPPLVTKVEELRGRGRLFRDADPETLVVSLASDRAWGPARLWLETVDEGTASIWGVPVVYNLDEGRLSSRWMSLLADRVRATPWSRRAEPLRLAGVSVVVSSRRLDVAGLRERAGVRVAPGGEYRVYALDGELPRVWWVPSVHVSDTPEEAAARLTDPRFRADRDAVVEAPTGAAPVTSASWWWLQPRVVLWQGSAGGGTPGALVTRFQWHPGLILEVDGERRCATRMNVAFAGVPVGAGEHAVRVLFAPRSVLVGAGVSIASALALVGWTALSGRQWRRSRPRRPGC